MQSHSANKQNINTKFLLLLYDDYTTFASVGIPMCRSHALPFNYQKVSVAMEKNSMS